MSGGVPLRVVLVVLLSFVVWLAPSSESTYTREGIAEWHDISLGLFPWYEIRVTRETDASRTLSTGVRYGNLGWNLLLTVVGALAWRASARRPPSGGGQGHSRREEPPS